MGYAYDREKNDKLESNDSESTYEEDVYDTLEKIRRNNITLKNNKSNQIERYISVFIDNSTRLSEYKKEIKKSIVSLLTSFSILAGATFGYGGLTALIASRNKVMPSATLTYNEVTGYSKDIEYVKIGEGESKTYIKVYEPWGIDTTREVKTYDVSSLSDMDLEEYLKLNLEEMEIDYTTLIETLSDNEETILNSDEVREVVRTTSYPDKAKANTLVYGLSLLLYIVSIFIYWIFSVNLKKSFTYKFYNESENINKNKWNVKLINSKINKYDLRGMLEYCVLMTSIIKENEELKNKFIEEFNKLSCSDPSGIMEEFSNVCDMIDSSAFSRYDEVQMLLKKRGIYE